MRHALLLVAGLLAVSPMAAWAAPTTTTSVGPPMGYPCYNQPKPEVAPGLPPQAQPHQEHLEAVCNSNHGTTAQMRTKGAAAASNQTRR